MFRGQRGAQEGGRLAKEGHRRGDSTSGMEQRLDRLPLLVDCTIEVSRFRPGPNVGLIDAPGRADWLRPAVPPPLVLRNLPVDPAHDRRVADVHVPLGHQRHEITIARAVGKVLANAALDDFTRKPPTSVYGIAFSDALPERGVTVYSGDIGSPMSPV